jgi:hypothetical protein
MSKKEDVILESITDYAKNPDTYDKNIEILKSQPDVSYQENESSPTFERSKLAISFLIRVLSSDFVVFFLVR